MEAFTKRRVAAAVLVFLTAVFCRPAAAADRADKREIIQKARAAYYSLRRSGFDSFQVNLTVNWDVVLGEAKTGTDPAQRTAAMKLLNGLHFGAAMDSTGKTTVTHRADTPAPNKASQDGYDQIFSGMDQVITGFYQTYLPFMITSPFPEVAGDYTLEDAAYGYRATWKEGGGRTEVTLRMTKNFAILEMLVNAPEFDSSIRPSFTTMDGLFVMTGYEGDYRPTQTKAGVVRLAAQIDHTVVDGLRLVRHLYMKSSLDDVSNQTDLTYADYTVKKK